MKLTVIIVNYNVKHFLYQCLDAVFSSQCSFSYEVIVVDNGSQDQSQEFIQQFFPQVKYIYSAQNLGFSKANNLGLREAQGEYVLFLNPDTIIAEDTLRLCVEYMDQHNEVGGLGVRMIDGTGNFLPESKRGLPTPLTSFFKISGVASLFPKSSYFNRYHLGHLDEFSIHEVEVLSGAFMLVRKNILLQTGGFDEDYFMYGEDIDLSYRILKLGYKNVYFPLTTIVHYKGESTQKDSLRYVKNFYEAMAIFAKKHVFKPGSKIDLIIIPAITIRGIISGMRRIVQNFALPLIENALFYVLIIFLAKFYEQSVKMPKGEKFPEEFFIFYPLVMVFVHFFIHYIAGSYDKPYSLLKMNRGWVAFAITTLLIYSVLPENYRYSRLLLVLMIISSYMITGLVRFIFSKLHFIKIKHKKFPIACIISDLEGVKVIKNNLDRSGIFFDIVLTLAPEKEKHKEAYFAKDYHLKDVLFCFQPGNLFCNRNNFSYKQIIGQLSETAIFDSIFRIYHPTTGCIIAPKEVITSEDIYLHDEFSINHPTQRRLKRITDLLISGVIIFIFPFIFFLWQHPMRVLYNTWQVITGRKTWVGLKIKNLEFLDECIIFADEIYIFNEKFTPEQQMIQDYLKNYNPFKDLKFIFANLEKLDN